MNKDGKIKGKFNIIDVLAVILVIAVILGLAVRFKSSVTTAVKSDEEFIYTVRVEGVRAHTIDALKKGGKLTDKKSEKDLGEIVSVRRSRQKSRASVRTERLSWRTSLTDIPQS